MYIKPVRTGTLCLPLWDIGTLIETLESVIGNHLLRQELGEALRVRMVTRFSREVRAEELMRLYREMSVKPER